MNKRKLAKKVIDELKVPTLEHGYKEIKAKFIKKKAEDMNMKDKVASDDLRRESHYDDSRRISSAVAGALPIPVVSQISTVAAAEPGKKMRTLGGSIGGGILGSTIGAVIEKLVTKGKGSGFMGATIGSVIGGGAGSYLAHGPSEKTGSMKEKVAFGLGEAAILTAGGSLVGDAIALSVENMSDKKKSEKNSKWGPKALAHKKKMGWSNSELSKWTKQIEGYGTKPPKGWYKKAEYKDANEKVAGRTAATIIGGSPTYLGPLLSGVAADDGRGLRTTGSSILGSLIGGLAGIGAIAATGATGGAALIPLSLLSMAGGATGAYFGHGEDKKDKGKKSINMKDKVAEAKIEVKGGLDDTVFGGDTAANKALGLDKEISKKPESDAERMRDKVNGAVKEAGSMGIKRLNRVLKGQQKRIKKSETDNYNSIIGPNRKSKTVGDMWKSDEYKKWKSDLKKGSITIAKINSKNIDSAARKAMRKTGMHNKVASAIKEASVAKAALIGGTALGVAGLGSMGLNKAKKSMAEYASKRTDALKKVGR
jgi:hypothetical protein